MCFDNDYDWIADVYQMETRVVAEGEEIGCHECGARIHPGADYTYIFMQEHEECKVCELEEAEEPCEEHDYGETYEYQRCNTCSTILDAIEAVEIEEGCPPGARRPALCELVEVFSDRRDAKRYAVKAVELHPELSTHQWIACTLAEGD